MKRTKPARRGRPPLPPAEVRHLISVRLAPKTLRALDVLAKRAGETRTAVIERLIMAARAPGSGEGGGGCP